MWWDEKKLRNYYCCTCKKLIEVQYRDEDLRSTYTVDVVSPHDRIYSIFSTPVFYSKQYYCKADFEELKLCRE